MISWRNFENEARLTSGREAYEILYNAWKERRTLISRITVGINIFGPTFDLAPERLATRRGDSNYAKTDKVFARGGFDCGVVDPFHQQVVVYQ